ncbi:MAG: AAA family ATPase [Acidobacteria bacterium]|nr:AAA family ATPase [Acidobacteriota bacterium]MBI3657966.1 AAA family ATPase [Acidobacteriota bacterium]
MKGFVNQLNAAIFSPDEDFRETIKEELTGTGLVEISAECDGYYSSVDFWFFDDLKRLNPDLAVVDLTPDPESGITTTQKLQELEQPPAVFVISHQPDPELIIRAMRAGASEFLVKPVRREQLVEALNRAGKQREGMTRSRKQSGKVYTFFSTKGGNGATTISTNFAVNLARQTGKTVLLADLDMQLGEVSLFMGLKPRFNMVDVLENSHRLDRTLLDGFIMKHSSGVQVLASPDHLSKSDVLSSSHISEIISFLRDQYDYVVLDTSNSFDNFAKAAFDYSDRIFVVSNTDLPSLRNTQRCLHMFDQLGFKREQVKMIINRYQKGREISIKDIEKILDCAVYWSFPNDYSTVIASINTGVPLATVNNSEIAHSLDKFTQEISGVETKASAPAKKAGILSFLRR